jgi:hypothetical protein
MTLVNGVADGTIAELLGIEREGALHPGETEHPDLIAWVSLDEKDPGKIPSAVMDWRGKANRLSRDHDDWPAIERVHLACTQQAEAFSAPSDRCETPFIHVPTDQDAGHVIRTRRSAQAMDGETSVPSEVFYSVLARVTPGLTACPWDAQTWPAMVSLGLFVHLVDGLEPGLYLHVRSPDHEEELRETLAGDFEWTRPDGCPEALQCFRLRRGDARDLAAKLSCTQDIAGMSAFSLGMFARFDAAIEAHGASFYRRLFWETGMIGQVLYLDAEAYGLRGTGIGCYFDDLVHRCFGIETTAWQSLYHFTVGGPLSDERLVTLPAYGER